MAISYNKKELEKKKQGKKLEKQKRKERSCNIMYRWRRSKRYDNRKDLS